MGKETLETLEKSFYKEHPNAPSHDKGLTIRRKPPGRKAKIGKGKHH